ncbi:MAG: MBL fold metallo-hydrolase [Eubacteriales bacterium]
MSLFCTIASGSKGNAAILSHCSTNILIDAGISCRRLTAELKRFNIKPSDLTAVIITHEHSDHIKGLETLYKRHRIPVYMSVGTASGIEKSIPLIHSETGIFYAGDGFEIGEVGVETFSTPHDAKDSVGFLFTAGRTTLGYATDLGYVTPQIQRRLVEAECLFIESNHDLFSLLEGPYPDFLKRRILSRRGHLSNDACADFVTEAVRCGARRVSLCHLSEQNNTPELALEATMSALKTALDIAPSDGLTVDAAPPNSAGVPYIF